MATPQGANHHHSIHLTARPRSLPSTNPPPRTHMGQQIQLNTTRMQCIGAYLAKPDDYKAVAKLNAPRVTEAANAIAGERKLARLP